MNEIYVWGIKISPLTRGEIIQLIDMSMTQTDRTFHLTGVNPETISKANENSYLRNAINDSDIVNIDNMLVVCFLRLLGYKIPERVACPDIFEELMSLGNSKGFSTYFFGAHQEVLDLMLKKIEIKYPNLNITGSRNGYYKKEDEESIVREIKKLKPDMLFIALPTPQKELFIHLHKHTLGAKFAFGVGGAFDVQAGKVVRAPLWMRNIGLEGFHRGLQNPANYGARTLKYSISFIKLFFKELFKKRSQKSKN
jgi:N-acetylglucosaminyldiphosphoundecaprenol N-acetyl-beta-D-mannosaminyltransferase